MDYGTGPMVRDPQSGKHRRTRLFVMTLGHSRKSVRLLVFRSSSQVWAELHEKAFRRLGGATRVVVLDNLREGAITFVTWCENVRWKDRLNKSGTPGDFKSITCQFHAVVLSPSGCRTKSGAKDLFFVSGRYGRDHKLSKLPPKMNSGCFSRNACMWTSFTPFVSVCALRSSEALLIRAASR